MLKRITSSINVGELRTWCVEKSKVPENDNDSFFVQYDISDDGEYFRFFVSSIILLSLAIDCVVINADATYKMVWQGFSVLVIGTIDQDRNFYLFGLATALMKELRTSNLFSIQ